MPFSRRFVRHIAGWYAQKHPDEDFAETFAVWLTPRSQWRQRYKGWGALAQAPVRRPDGAPPARRASRCGRRATPTSPSRRWRPPSRSSTRRPSTSRRQSVELALDTDLVDIFKVSKRRKKGTRPASDLLRENRKTLIDKVTYWTGVQRPLVRRLVESIEARVAELGLRVAVREEKGNLTEVSAYATALAMNYLARGQVRTALSRGEEGSA